MIKGFRRLKHDKRGYPGCAREPKNEISTIAPKKIIRALYDYTAASDDEMGFKEKEFLYVVNDSDLEWYVACNPLTNTSGLVPVSYFEVVHRRDDVPALPVSQASDQHQRATAGLSLHSRTESAASGRTSASAKSGGRKRASLAVYGLVLYDFKAERSDELDAKAGESIVIIAQSTHEWFVAKPIGRLGGPGLIPVSYIELREVGTDRPLENVEDVVRSAGIPQVEEWKRRAAEYKASSIVLGRIEGTSVNNGRTSARTSARISEPSPNSVQEGPEEDAAARANPQCEPYAVRGSVDRFAIAGDRYWYLVLVELSNGRFRALGRYYSDFYSFQLRLLDEFPVEAGRTGKPRVLPFIPGPLSMVDNTIASQRRSLLDNFLRQLVRMEPQISQSHLLRSFFSLEQEDIEGPTPVDEMPVIRIEPLTADLRKIEGQILTSASSSSVASEENHNGRHFDDGISPRTSAVPPSRHLEQNEFIKVKIFHGTELIALRIPADLQFESLRERVASRLGNEEIQLYGDENFTTPKVTGETFGSLVNSAGKAILYAR